MVIIYIAISKWNTIDFLIYFNTFVTNEYKIINTIHGIDTLTLVHSLLKGLRDYINDVIIFL